LILKAAIKLADVLIMQDARDIILIIGLNISVRNLRANKNNFDKDEIA